MGQSIALLDNDGATAVPGGDYSFGTKIAGTTTTRKLWFLNDGTLPLTAHFIETLVDQLLNGGVGVIKAALDTATVRPPYGGAAVESADAGTFDEGDTWYFLVVRGLSGQQTQPCRRFQFTVVDGAKGIDLAWLLPPGGAAGDDVKVYASLDGDDFTNSLIADLGASDVDFTWDGTAPGAGTPAGVNTTAGAAPAYGTAPSLGTSPMDFGVLAPTEARPFWAGFLPPSSDPGQDYLVALTPSVTA